MRSVILMITMLYSFLIFLVFLSGVFATRGCYLENNNICHDMFKEKLKDNTRMKYITLCSYNLGIDFGYFLNYPETSNNK